VEFIVELIFEFFGDLLLQIVFETLAEAGLHLVRKSDAERAPAAAWKLVVGYTLLGAVVGAISLWVFPHAMAHSHFARVTNLLLAPIASGLAMALVGAWRQRRGQQVLGIDRFAYGYMFALSMAVVRFIWAS
jgi:cytochrome bd-type quinol oxidase subunit 2